MTRFGSPSTPPLILKVYEILGAVECFKEALMRLRKIIFFMKSSAVLRSDNDSAVSRAPRGRH